MSESLLQKQFSEKDISRMRNIVSKKYGDKSTTSVGYQSKQIQYKEGEVFEEGGKRWIIKNGIKVSYSKLDIIKKTLQLPLVCPHCSNAMKNKFDKHMYFIHKRCFNCVLKYESKLKMEGKFEDYQRNFLNNNATSFIEDLKSELYEYINSGMTNFITEDGDTEQWQDNVKNKEALKKEIEEYIQSIKSQLTI